MTAVDSKTGSKPRRHILRPLGFGGLFDEVFDLYKSNFVLMVGIAGLTALPVDLLFGIPRIQRTLGVPGGLLNMFFLSFGRAATIWAISRLYLGYDACVLTSYRAMLKRLRSLLLTFVPIYLIVCAPMLMSFIFVSLSSRLSPFLIMLWSLLLIAALAFAVIIYFRVIFTAPIIMIEGKSGLSAIKRSTEMVSGNSRRVLAYWLIAFFIGLVLSITLRLPFTHWHVFARVELSVPASIVAGISSMLVAPIHALVFTLLYYDIRVRREGFDIQMLAQSMETENSQ